MSNFNQPVHYGQSFSPSPEFNIAEGANPLTDLSFELELKSYSMDDNEESYTVASPAKLMPLYRQPGMAATSSTFSSSSPTIGHDRQTAPTPTSVLDDNDRFTSPNILHFNRRASAGAITSPAAPPAISHRPSGLNISGVTPSYSHNDLGFFEPPIMPASNVPYRHVPSNDISMNLSEFLKQDPFRPSSDPSHHWPPVKLEHCHDNLSDPLDNEADFPRNFPHHEGFTPPQGAWLEDTSKASSSSIHRGEKSPYIGGPSGANSPRKVRKAKSFTAGSYRLNSTAGPAFSLQDCSNEFHVSDGMIKFQDETARVSKQVGQNPPTKRKSSSKLPKNLSTLRKAQTMTNLCSKATASPESKGVRKMESGLVSFQVKLNNEED